MHNLLLLALVFAAISGCAYNQEITLVDVGVPLAHNNRVTIIDERDAGRKSTRLMVDGQCSRWYGDGFIRPSKLAYLEYATGKAYTGSDPIAVTVTKYDTIEYCLDTAKRMTVQSQAIALAATTGNTQYYTLPGFTGGDFFRLQLSGQVNGKPFEFVGDFVYSDLAFRNFPSENQTYRARVAALFDKAVSHILSVARVKPAVD